jgi:hypothetical protein
MCERVRNARYSVPMKMTIAACGGLFSRIGGSFGGRESGVVRSLCSGFDCVFCLATVGAHKGEVAHEKDGGKGTARRRCGGGVATATAAATAAVSARARRHVVGGGGGGGVAAKAAAAATPEVQSLPVLFEHDDGHVGARKLELQPLRVHRALLVQQPPLLRLQPSCALRFRTCVVVRARSRSLAFCRTAFAIRLCGASTRLRRALRHLWSVSC